MIARIESGPAFTGGSVTGNRLTSPVSVVDEADVAPLADDDVVEDADAHEVADFAQAGVISMSRLRRGFGRQASLDGVGSPLG